MPKTQQAQIARRIPAQARSRYKVALILDAAAQLLERDGEEAVVTNAVAQRSGCSIGTLYQYFRDRDAILVALAERERRRIADRMMELLGGIAKGEGGEPLVRRFVAALIESFARRRGARRQFALMLSTAATQAQKANGKPMNDEFSLILMASWRDLGLGGGGQMDRINAYVLTRAVLGVVRSAAFENTDLMGQKDFEDALVRLIISFDAAGRKRDRSIVDCGNAG